MDHSEGSILVDADSSIDIELKFGGRACYPDRVCKYSHFRTCFLNKK